MKLSNLFIILTFSVFSVTIATAQKPILTDEEQITKIVTAEIDALFQSKDFLKIKAKKYVEVKGAITIDVGIVSNGKV